MMSRQSGSETEPNETEHNETEPNEQTQPSGMSYWRFGAMIATSVAVMYALTYLNTFELSHVMWSEERLYMVLIMGASMSVIMLSFMLPMYSNRRRNIAIFAGSLIVFLGALWIVRSQAPIEEEAYMSSMIPHHSIAILTSERSNIEDVRVCRLAVEIIEAQNREIAEMKWLIDDIEENGVADSTTEAEARPVPEFSAGSIRTCAGG